MPESVVEMGISRGHDSKNRAEFKHIDSNDHKANLISIDTALCSSILTAMPYFLILPAYFALLLGLSGAAVIARLVPRFRILSGYIVGGTIGTLFGFIVSNALVWIIGLLPVWLNKKNSFPDWLLHVSRLFVAGTLLIGPFAGSAIGVLIGFTAGLYHVFGRRRRKSQCVFESKMPAAPSQTPPPA